LRSNNLQEFSADERRRPILCHQDRKNNVIVWHALAMEFSINNINYTCSHWRPYPC